MTAIGALLLDPIFSLSLPASTPRANAVAKIVEHLTKLLDHPEALHKSIVKHLLRADGNQAHLMKIVGEEATIGSGAPHDVYAVLDASMVPLLALERALKKETEPMPEEQQQDASGGSCCGLDRWLPSCCSTPGLWVALAVAAASVPLLVAALVLARSTPLDKDQAAAPRDTMMTALFFFGAGLILFAAVTLASAFVFSKIHFKGSYGGAEFEINFEAVHTMGKVLKSVDGNVKALDKERQATSDQFKKIEEVFDVILQTLDASQASHEEHEEQEAGQDEPPVSTLRASAPRPNFNLQEAIDGAGGAGSSSAQQRAAAISNARQRLEELRRAGRASEQQQIASERRLADQTQLVRQMSRQLPALGKTRRSDVV